MQKSRLSTLTLAKRLVTFSLGWLLGLATSPLFAAPLDALLTALPEQSGAAGHADISVDLMNHSLDFFKVKDSDPSLANTRAGDYKGGHLALAYPVSERLWLSGSYWQRAISDASDTHHYNSWQVAGQYRFVDAVDRQPALALRLSAWGNYAAAVTSSAAVNVPGAILNSVKINAPADRQLQADLLGTWKLSPSTNVSAMLGVGKTQLSYSELTATTTRNGCNYQLRFNKNDIFGTLASPCNATGGVIEQFYDSSGSYGVDVAKEIAWRGSFIQVGANAVWRDGPWTLSGGYLVHAIKRQAVDNILASRGQSSFSRNQNLTLQAAYRIHSHVYLIANAQLDSNLFLSDLPVTYNSSTAAKFSHRYSLFGVGIRAEF